MEDCNDIKHEEIKKRLNGNKNYLEAVKSSSKMFSLLGDESRMKILLSLMSGELCVFHICEIVNNSQSAVSQHLRKLKDAKIVKSRKEGNQVLYSICDKHIEEIITSALAHRNCK